MQHKEIQDRQSVAQLARTFAAYTRLQYSTEEGLCAEVKRQRNIMRNANDSWRQAHRLPCGHQDALADEIGESISEFHAVFDAIRLLKDRMPRNIQQQMLFATGEL